MTANRSLFGWLDDPAAHRGLRTAREGGWDFVSYRDLAATARQVAAGLTELGIRRNDRVVVLQQSPCDFAAAFFGVLVVGAVPIPVAPPLTFQDPAAYAAHIINVVRTSEPAAVLTAPDLSAHMAACKLPTTTRLVAGLPLAEAGPTGSPTFGPGAIALLQFTSGSSGLSRGVQVPVDSLEANIGSIRSWLGMTSDDVVATWLPLYHDMGLIGCFLTPLLIGADLWIMQPEQFVLEPVRWLRCFGEAGATLTAAPNFGLSYIVRRVKPHRLTGLDFSGWRGLIVGAERIDKAVVDEFSALLAPFGFDRRAILPAYGLAEATLAVTGSPLDADVRSLRIAAGSSKLGMPVKQATPIEDAGYWVVGNGMPLEGVDVNIVDEAEQPLGTDVLGEIVVRGASVAAGYVSGPDAAGGTSFHGERVRTGDAGFFHDGELFVVGRIGDSVKVRGRSVFAEDVETMIVTGSGIQRHRLAVLLGTLEGSETVIVVVEGGVDGKVDQVVDTAQRCVPGARIRVLSGGRGSILRTTSGKPRRKPMWTKVLNGSDDFSVVFQAEPRHDLAVASSAGSICEGVDARGVEPRSAAVSTGSGPEHKSAEADQMADAIGDLDATDQAALVRSGALTPEELVELTIGRIERVNGLLNAVVTPLYDKARAAAGTGANNGPFTGVPMLLKDAVAYSAGDPHHCGMQVLKDVGWVEPDDTWLVSRLRAAGFVLVGKTNVPELTTSVTTEPLAYGPTRNPWNVEYSPGGSSGGSAAAVASGMVAIAHGNDTGGSIRIPASACGVVGLKPSRGRTTFGPHRGEYWGMLGTEHVLTRSVRDCAALLDVTSGPGLGDPYSAPRPQRRFADEVGADPGVLLIGFRTIRRARRDEAHPDCVAAVHKAATLLESLGHRVEPVELPAFDDARLAESVRLFPVYVAAELNRWSRKLKRSIRPDELDPWNQMYAEMGASTSAIQYASAVEQSQLYARRLAEWWADGWDVLLTPQLPTPPPKLGVLNPTNDPAKIFATISDLSSFTTPFNATGQPAMSLPIHWNDDGLPIGVQLVAASGREDVLIRLASQLELAEPWRHHKPPVHVETIT